jgi:RNA-binding protein YhbY
MIGNVIKFQIGKNGLTENSLQAIENLMKHYRQIRISVLKSAEARNKQEMVVIAEKICSHLGFTRDAYRIIGFTIILTRLGKAKSVGLKNEDNSNNKKAKKQ